MRFMQLQGFTVRQDQATAFQRWLVANDARIRAAYPPGTGFAGCYAAVFTSEKEAGSLYWVETLDSYAALDTLAAASKDATSALFALNAEFVAFLEPALAAPYSKILLKDMLDATVLDLPSA